MYSSVIIAFAVVAAGRLCTAQIIGDPPTVDQLDLSQYYGQWYQTHTSPLPLATYLKDGVCGTATYKICNNETIGVYNHQRLFFPDGIEDFLEGTAQLTDEPGKLKLYLEGIPEGDYWVMKTGPVRTYEVFNEAYEIVERDLYAYSLVTDPRRISLFILARDVPQFKKEYEAEALDFLYENGFNTPANNPVEFYHGNDCVYADPNPDFPC